MVPGLVGPGCVRGGGGGLTPSQASAFEGLQHLDPALEARFSPYGDVERVWFSKPMGCTPGSLAAFLKWMEAEVWDDFARLLGVGPEDAFDLRIETTGLAGKVWGYRLVYHRSFGGIEVPQDEVRVYLVLGDGPEVKLRHGKEYGLLDIEEPDEAAPICLAGIEATFLRDLALIVGAARFELSEEEAEFVATVASGVEPDSSGVRPVVWRSNGFPRLAWDVAVYQGGLEIAGEVIDAQTGEVLHERRPTGQFKVWTQALNPHESYQAGSSRPFKPFPRVEVYSAIESVQCEPGRSISRGRELSRLGTTDYRGNTTFADPGGVLYLDQRLQQPPASRDLEQVASLGEPGGYCFWDGDPDDYCGWCRLGSWLPCTRADCNNWVNSYYYYHTYRTGNDRFTYWFPSDSGIQCIANNVAQVRQHVGPSSRQGRRKEVLYHAAIAQHFWQDYLLQTMPSTEVRVVQKFDIGPNTQFPACGGGKCFGAVPGGASTVVQIGCDLCSFEQQNAEYRWEAHSRSAIYHEFGHVADRGMHGQPSYPSSDDPPGTYLPDVLAEAISVFTSYVISFFERSDYFGGQDNLHRSPSRGADFLRTYPRGYVCCSPNGCNPYDQRYRAGYLWRSVWIDFIMASGLPVGMPVLKNHFAGAEFLGLLRLLDRECINTHDYSSCYSNAYGTTFYRKMFDSAILTWSPDLALTFETAKAWQGRITDWDPGNFTADDCQGPNAGPELNNQGGAGDNDDPDSDFAPWFDEVTNVTWYAPYLPLDTHGEQVYFGSSYGYGHRYGPFAEGPATCTNRSATAQGKYLAIDYVQDLDKFIFIGRGGRQYFIYTVAGPGSSADTNTILEVRSSSGQLVAQNDDSSDREMPPNGTKFSCLRFTPGFSAPYRLVVLRGPNGAYGSRARYRLVVESRGDDYPNSQQDASPVPPGTSVEARINTSGDSDWYYQTVLSGGATMDLLVTLYSGEPPIHVLLKDHTGRALVDQWVSAATYFPFSDQPKGTYYLHVSSSSPSQYFFYWTNNSAPGNSHGTAYALGSPDVPTPLPSIGLTSRIDVANGKHYFKKAAGLGEACVLDAHATVGKVRLWLERDTRPGTDEWNKVVPGAAANAWETLVEDDHGGMVAEGREKSHAHASFIAPWPGDYFVVVEATDAPASYTLWVGCGLVWSQYPEFP